MNDALLNESLLAVMDGRASTADWARVNAAWDHDPALRERWALWHAAGDGLRSAELLGQGGDSQQLLDALHARLPAAAVERRSWRDWLAPLAVAASFVALAFGLGTLRPPASAEPVIAAAPFSTPRAQGLGGQSFAQTAAGRTLPTADAAPEIIDWGLALPEPAASRSER